MKSNYLIYGIEDYLIKYNIKKILKLNKEYTKITFDMRESSIEEVLEEVNTYSLFDNSKIVICENCVFLSSEYKKDNNYNIDLLNEYLEKSNNDNILIFTINDDIDERKKIVKTIKKNSNIIKCDRLNENQIYNFIKQRLDKTNFKMEDIFSFIDRCGNNLDILVNELNKLMFYKINERYITLEDIIMLVPKKKEDNIFELIDAIVLKDIKKTFELYDIFTSYYKEEPTKIIVMVANQFRLILQVKILYNNGLSESDIAKNLKVHPYRVKLALQKSKNLSIDKLSDYLLELSELDLNIKNGNKDKFRGLESFFLNM